RAFSVALAGGGVKGGQVIGATSADGTDVKTRAVTVGDLFCSFYHALKIKPRKENLSGIGRPVKLIDNGQAGKELLPGEGPITVTKRCFAAAALAAGANTEASGGAFLVPFPCNQWLSRGVWGCARNEFLPAFSAQGPVITGLRARAGPGVSFHR